MTMKYTLVRHTGFSVGGNPQFERAVELRCLSTAKEVAAVARAGGLLFNTYTAASDAEDDVNYPPEVTGLIPRAAGRFSRSPVLQEEVYIPA